MKKILTALALSLVTLVPAAFAADTPVLAKPVIKIGASLPLTGDNAHLGESVRDAMILAKDGLPSDTKFDYEIIFEDDGLEPKKAAIATNKLISVDKINALVSLNSSTGSVISPITEQNKVIHFGIASAQKIADGDYNFIHETPPVEHARLMAEELKKRGVKTIALFNLNHAGALEINDRLKEKLSEAGIAVVFEDIADFGETDFRTAIAKAKATNADMYYVLFYSPEIDILTKQMRESGIKANITSIQGFGISTDISLYEGLWYVDSADTSEGFNEKFKARFGKEPQWGASNAYDIVNILVQGFETATVAPDVIDGKPTQEAVVNAIHKVSFDGMKGKISIDDKGVVFSPATVKIIKDGKPVALDSVTSEPVTE